MSRQRLRTRRPAVSAAFDAVFGVFVVLIVGLVVVSVRWGMRRDRAVRETRHTSPPPAGNRTSPRPDG
ncbi:MAG: hypothetical protein ABSB99_09035 [Acidimicrobiales bacterium]